MRPAAAAAAATATAAALRLRAAAASLSSPPAALFTPCRAAIPRAAASPVMDAQFESFRAQLDESSTLRDRIRAVVSEIESASRVATAALLLVHQPVPLEDVLGKAKAQVEVIKGLYAQLAEVLKECPGQYYRYHGDWRSETQAVVSMLAFMHWLETDGLLMHTDAQEKLGLSSGEFCLDVEDYLTGLCFMSNEFVSSITDQTKNSSHNFILGICLWFETENVVQPA
uniref:Translin n=1 Tax=Setaria italica TaxID=4555 RepID=K4ALG9_SETIT